MLINIIQLYIYIYIYMTRRMTDYDCKFTINRS